MPGGEADLWSVAATIFFCAFRVCVCLESRKRRIFNFEANRHLFVGFRVSLRGQRQFRLDFSTAFHKFEVVQIIWLGAVKF